MSDGSAELIVSGGTPPYITEDLTNLSAGNYSTIVTDFNDCEISLDFILIEPDPETIYDCFGNCFNDFDGDGVCNENEIIGCQEEEADNFNPLATDSGSCEYLGCTNTLAANYDQNSNVDDGSCEYGPWGPVYPTQSNHQIAIPNYASITFDGETISEGDWIGVFYTNSNGNLTCGGSISWEGVTTNLAAWGSEQGLDNGFQSSEEFTWIIWDNETNQELIATATYLDDGSVPNTNTYVNNGLSAILSLTALSSISQEIEIPIGWSYWSTYVHPENSNIESVVTEITNNVDIVKNWAGSVYWPLFGINTIGEIVRGEGYQIKMSDNDILQIQGELTPFDFNILLPGGWFLMGYLHQNPYNVVNMVEPLVTLNNLSIIKDYLGNVYWPLFGINTIQNMIPGQGYQVKTDDLQTFSYPSGGRFGFSDVTLVDKTIFYDSPYNTGNNMTVGLPTSAWDIMPAIGDEIAAYDESGKLIGSTTFGGENIALTVWGDDHTTSNKDGLAIGEKVTFKLWNSDMNTESTLIVTKWDAGSDEYAVDGISIASNIIISGSESANAYKLYQNEPNPFNGTTTVKFYVPENSEVMIGVYNMLGEYVAEVTNSRYDAGKHEVEFKSNDLGQGTYFVKMTTGNFTATRNMNIIK